MIRVEDVGMSEGSPHRYARRGMPGVSTDIDAVLFCPRHELEEEQARAIYDEFGAEHTEWVEEHFPSVAKEMVTVDTFGFLFVEIFEDYYLEYECPVEMDKKEEGAYDFKIETAVYRKRQLAEGVSVPFRYKVCESIVSGLWFNSMIKEHDLDRDLFEISLT